MSIDKDLLDRLMEGRSPGDIFGKKGILSDLTKALAERALHLCLTATRQRWPDKIGISGRIRRNAHTRVQRHQTLRCRPDI